MTSSRHTRASESPTPATPPHTLAAAERAQLPGRLQACFVVESETFSWWGVEDPAAAAAGVGLPTGAPGFLRVALPNSGQVLAATVPAAHVVAAEAIPALAELSRRAPEADGDSLRLWAQIAAHLRASAPVSDDELTALAGRLPTAGHAALAMDGVTIWSATATVNAARHAVAARDAGAAEGVESVLRPYQRAGANWLRAAETHGGGLLADEMGLGKTLQAIAVLAGRRKLPHLVVCPTSLISNWARELAKFAPHVPVLVYAGARRTDTLSDVEPGTVVVTSYGLLRSNATDLAAQEWDVVVLDEAQQIKNPDALAARAARALNARLRVAMTGTPVENRLDELWSLLAFTNPGLLGTRARFRRRFAVSIEQRGSAAAATRLHEIVAPHILRRLKRDVAPELPDKIEATVVCVLTDEQQRLYRTCLDDSFAGGLGSGIGRRGRILALLTRLKRICNHPEHVAPTGEELAGRSGKLDRATEILAEIVDAGDRALIFTQYRDTGELLARHLTENVTGPAAAVPFLHGGLALRRRDEMVEQYQNDPDSPPILVLSLRAAGFGLNLTRATHVLHYDRWWNPAVEDQASDRAHRIGQTRTLTVHTLITEGTVEDAIDQMHAGKRNLAGVALGTTTSLDTALVRLSDEHLRALLDLTPASTS